jgi:hypothetical protein
MKIEGHHRRWEARDAGALEQVLRFRDDVGGAMFWLADDDEPHPAMAIRVSGDLADVHYFPHEGHPGFRALVESSAPRAPMTTFIYEGCDPAAGEETPSEFVLPAAAAIEIAKEFQLTGEMSAAVSWFEL